jgi:hypothetical protein
MSLRNALTAALLAMATLTHAASDHDKWVGQLQKYAVYVGSDTVPTIVDAFSKAKSACICSSDEGALANHPGYITVGDGVDGLLTICAVPIFDSNGAFESAAGCAKFAPLVK